MTKEEAIKKTFLSDEWKEHICNNLLQFKYLIIAQTEYDIVDIYGENDDKKALQEMIKPSDSLFCYIWRWNQEGEYWQVAEIEVVNSDYGLRLEVIWNKVDE